VRSDERPSRRQRARARRAGRAPRAPIPRAVALLLVAAFLLTGIGLVMVLSASSVTSYQSSGDSFLYLKRQAVYAAIGSVALLATLRISYRRWERWALPLLLVSVALLALALHPSIGSMRGGSSRWIVMGPVTIQPSELAKLAMVVFVAAILTRKWRRLDKPGHVLIPLAPVVLAVCGLIILQRDLGTTTIIAATVFVLVFAAGVRMRYLVFTGFVAVAAGWMLIMGEHYRKVRFLSFLHPWADRTNTGYQLIQSLLGLGSGGLFGVGLGASRAKWSYIPNAHTDFIFSILGEELGLLGEVVVLALFVTLVYCGIRIASRATDTFGRLLATGIVAWLALQTLINLGAVTGVLPVTGVPLPFVSFGGSSLIVTLAAVGILANIGRTAVAENGTGEDEERRERRAGRRARRRERRLASGRQERRPRTGRYERRLPAATVHAEGTSPAVIVDDERELTRQRHPAGGGLAARAAAGTVRRAPRPTVHRPKPPGRTRGASRKGRARSAPGGGGRR
jgi:cell division protein FtsW